MPPPVAVAIAVVSSERERCEGGGAVERSESEGRLKEGGQRFCISLLAH